MWCSPQGCADSFGLPPLPKCRYGLYFGILARDSAEIASDRIAAALGGRRQMAVSVRDCGICGTALDVSRELGWLLARSWPWREALRLTR